MENKEQGQHFPQCYINNLKEEKESIAKRSWWDWLGQFLYSSRYSIEQKVVNDLLSKALGTIKAGDSVLYQMQQSFTIKKVDVINFIPGEIQKRGICHLVGDPIEYVHSLMNGDWIDFSPWTSRRIIPILESPEQTVFLLQSIWNEPLLYFKEKQGDAEWF